MNSIWACNVFSYLLVHYAFTSGNNTYMISLFHTQLARLPPSFALLEYRRLRQWTAISLNKVEEWTSRCSVIHPDAKTLGNAHEICGKPADQIASPSFVGAFTKQPVTPGDMQAPGRQFARYCNAGTKATDGSFQIRRCAVIVAVIYMLPCSVRNDLGGGIGRCR